MTDSTGHLEHDALLTAIGRALGSDVPYPEAPGTPGDALHLGTMKLLPVGTSREVLGGAVDAATGRVAWVEQRTGEPQGGYVPVSIDVHFAWEGHLRGQVEVPTYNPYFGCRVGFMRWYGDALVVIYREKHRTLALRLHPPAEALTLATLEDTWAFDEDTVYFVSQHPGLLEGRLLPSLEQALPLPVPEHPRSVQFWRHAPGALALAPWPPMNHGETRDAYQHRLRKVRESARLVPLPPRQSRAFSPRPERLWARLDALLASTAPPPLGVDVLVGAVATAFWRDERPLATGYASEGGRGSSPRFLPVYWYQHLRAGGRAVEAEAWLHWLERISGMPDVDATPWARGHDVEEAAARTALVYLRARAPVLAEACRTGRLPEGEYCYIFTTPDRTRRLEQDAHQPAGFREVLRQVVASRPKSLSESD
ncbi:hypothetical protein [Pyxidicoccus caerfyrddinensis]|uniref:hypothetical protein n=1 Tax=Pyxidicoccus caerfyrddinensis TaxID=2709663 RepID=UPI0013DA8878|nr:hypothetical protein [Pyxidicoccus caerfyrddinensis]